MGPAPTSLDNMLPASSSSLFNIPKLAEDGSNWITYKERMLTAIGALGLMRYIDGRVKQPIPFAMSPTTGELLKADGKPATDAEIEALDDKLDEFCQKNSMVKQHIFSTLSDRLVVRIKHLKSASMIWVEIRKLHEGKTELVQVDLRRRLQETRCEEGRDVRDHFTKLMTMREQLAGMGAAIDERDFYAIVLGSLPESYRPLLSAISATARITQKTLTTYELVNVITEEYEHRLLAGRGSSKKGANNSALSATTSTNNRRGANSKDVVCYNCERKGHKKPDCWRPGGGKEGQGPQQQNRNGAQSHKPRANVATAAADTTEYAFATSDMCGIANQLKIPVESRGAIIDSGASSHFCPDRSKFIDFTAIDPLEVRTADGSSISATGRGNVRIELPLGAERTAVTLKDVLYTPKMAFTLISTNRITAAGFTLHFEDRMCKMLSPAPARKVIGLIPQVDGLYSLAAGTAQQLPTTPGQAHVARAKVSVYELHKILGHVAQETVLQAYKKGLIEGIDLDLDSMPQFCDACAQAKATRQPFPAESTTRTRAYGQLIHTDLWGPAQTVSIGGSVYYISFTDDYSRETKIRFLKQKSDALEAFKQHIANLTKQHPEARVCKLRSDRGGEYMSTEFTQYLRDEGIERQLTVHDSPQQNGVAERLNRTLVEHARAMLVARDMPKFLWAEAIGYATWLKNRMHRTPRRPKPHIRLSIRQRPT